MRLKVKVDTSTIDSFIKQTKKFSSIMAKESEWLRGRIIRNWTKAKSPDGSTFRGLSKEYKEEKSKSGRKGIRDLNLTGAMYNGFKVFKKDMFKYVLGFARPELGKARGNNKRTPNMLKISKKLEDQFKKNVETEFYKGTK
jgi:hypothetical protein